MTTLIRAGLLFGIAACDNPNELELNLRYEITLPGEFNYNNDKTHIRSIHVVNRQTVVIEAGSQDSTLVHGFNISSKKFIWTLNLSERFPFIGRGSPSQRVYGASFIDGEFVFITVVKRSVEVRQSLRVSLGFAYALHWRPESKKTRVRELGKCSLEMGNQHYVPVVQGKTLISGGLSRPIFLDLRANDAGIDLPSEFAGHSMTYISLSSNLKYAACTSYQPEVWELENGRRVHAYVPPQEVINSWKPKTPGYRPTACDISPDNTKLAVGTDQGQFLLFDLRSATLIHWDTIADNSAGREIDAAFLQYLPGSRFVVLYSPFCVYDCEELAWVDLKSLVDIRQWLGPSPLFSLHKSMLVVAHRSGGKLRVYDFNIGED